MCFPMNNFSFFIFFISIVFQLLQAITEEIIGKMYDESCKPKNLKIKPLGAGGDDSPDRWGGPRLRRLLHCIYCISFVCLLRIDEALKIQVEHILYVPGHDRRLLKLTLPFWKTNQYGDIKPFYI
ncbi:hypothetical protein MPER_08526 [Moniliophthora perniciosa FA553]|nr:hypothetical protein MPER_08526 [Moniliophthora perniciosa FA553]